MWQSANLTNTLQNKLTLCVLVIESCPKCLLEKQLCKAEAFISMMNHGTIDSKEPVKLYLQKSRHSGLHANETQNINQYHVSTPPHLIPLLSEALTIALFQEHGIWVNIWLCWNRIHACLTRKIHHFFVNADGIYCAIKGVCVWGGGEGVCVCMVLTYVIWKSRKWWV